jgi:hypothetical protein
MHVSLGGEEVVAGRHLADSIEQRPLGTAAHVDTAEYRFRIPARRYPGGKERFRFRAEKEGALVLGEEQGLDPEPVAGGEKRLVHRIPEHQRELPAELVEALRPHVLVEMQRDLAVAPGAEPVPVVLEPTLDCFEPVELSVDDQVDVAVLAGDRLLPAHEVNDAEPRVTQAHVAFR